MGIFEGTSAMVAAAIPLNGDGNGLERPSKRRLESQRVSDAQKVLDSRRAVLEQVRAEHARQEARLKTLEDSARREALSRGEPPRTGHLDEMRAQVEDARRQVAAYIELVEEGERRLAETIEAAPSDREMAKLDRNIAKALEGVESNVAGLSEMAEALASSVREARGRCGKHPGLGELTLLATQLEREAKRLRERTARNPKTNEVRSWRSMF